MVKSTPSDLATAFRSFARRRREAAGDADPVLVADLVADLDMEIDEHVTASAALLRTEATTDEIVHELRYRPANAWDDETLDALRRRASRIGVLIRRIAQRVEAELGE